MDSLALYTTVIEFQLLIMVFEIFKKYVKVAFLIVNVKIRQKE